MWCIVSAKNQKRYSIIGDKTIELNETFKINLSNAVNAIILKAPGIGIIVNDDGMALAITADSIKSKTDYSIKVSRNPAMGILHVEASGFVGKITIQIVSASLQNTKLTWDNKTAIKNFSIKNCTERF